MTDGDVSDLQDRVVGARARLDAVPAIGAGEPGPPDPETGERWTRLHVLGHTAEMLPFWCAQVRGVLAGGDWIGREDSGYEQRQAAIDAGALGDEADLRARVGAGVDDLLSLLDEAGGSDLSREVEYRGLTETETESIRSLIEKRLVRHFESHVRQLQELTPTVAKNVRFESIAPVVTVSDLDAALDRYARLGFDVEPYEGGPRYGFVHRGPVSLHLLEWAKRDPRCPGTHVYIYVSDADALHAEWAAKGVEGKLGEPFDTDYGLREFSYVDPDKTTHRVGSPLPER